MQDRDGKKLSIPDSKGGVCDDDSFYAPQSESPNAQSSETKFEQPPDIKLVKLKEECKRYQEILLSNILKDLKKLKHEYPGLYEHYDANRFDILDKAKIGRLFTPTAELLAKQFENPHLDHKKTDRECIDRIHRELNKCLLVDRLLSPASVDKFKAALRDREKGINTNTIKWFTEFDDQQFLKNLDAIAPDVINKKMWFHLPQSRSILGFMEDLSKSAKAQFQHLHVHGLPGSPYSTPPGSRRGSVTVSDSGDVPCPPAASTPDAGLSHNLAPQAASMALPESSPKLAPAGHRKSLPGAESASSNPAPQVAHTSAATAYTPSSRAQPVKVAASQEPKDKVTDTQQSTSVAGGAGIGLICGVLLALTIVASLACSMGLALPVLLGIWVGTVVVSTVIGAGVKSKSNKVPETTGVDNVMRTEVKVGGKPISEAPAQVSTSKYDARSGTSLACSRLGIDPAVGIAPAGSQFEVDASATAGSATPVSQPTSRLISVPLNSPNQHANLRKSL